MKYSYSRISTYLRCPHLCRLRYVDQVPPESTSLALPFGSAIHDIVAYSVQNPDAGNLQGVLKEFLTSRLDECVAPVNFGKQTVEEVYSQAKDMLDAYLEEPLEDITSIEEPFKENLTKELELEGFIDYITTNNEIVELKTSGRSWSQLQADLSLHATCYAAAMPHNPVCVRFYVIVKNKVPKVQRISTWRTEEDLGTLVSIVEQVHRGFMEGVFPRNTGVQTCSGCEYKGLCLKTSV